MHVTAEGGAAKNRQCWDIRPYGERLLAVQQRSYKLVILRSKCIPGGPSSSEKREEQPSADCSIWQLQPILLKTFPSPGAHVPSLRHYQWDAWMPPHSFSHSKSSFLLIWKKLTQKTGQRAPYGLTCKKEANTVSYPLLCSLQQREHGFMWFHLYISNPSPPLP